MSKFAIIHLLPEEEEEKKDSPAFKPVKNKSFTKESGATPIFEVHWQNLHAKFINIASRLEDRSFMLRKHPIKMDLTKSKQCASLAKEIRRLSSRLKNWDNLSPEALEGEKKWFSEKYLAIVIESQKITNGEIP